METIFIVQRWEGDYTILIGAAKTLNEAAELATDHFRRGIPKSICEEYVFTELPLNTLPTPETVGDSETENNHWSSWIHQWIMMVGNADGRVAAEPPRKTIRQLAAEATTSNRSFNTIIQP